MFKPDLAHDVADQSMVRGDTVSSLAGQMTGRICDIASQEDTLFVMLRPVGQPYAVGVWYAADQVLRLGRSGK
jgi:hypothetical protein